MPMPNPWRIGSHFARLFPAVHRISWTLSPVPAFFELLLPAPVHEFVLVASQVSRHTLVRRTERSHAASRCTSGQKGWGWLGINAHEWKKKSLLYVASVFLIAFSQMRLLDNLFCLRKIERSIRTNVESLICRPDSLRTERFLFFVRVEISKFPYF